MTTVRCAVPTCDAVAYCRGYCAPHYWRLVKAGDVFADRPIVPKSKNTAARIAWFQSQPVVTPSGCHEWPGARTRNGYGLVHLTLHGQSTKLAHRAAWMIAKGPIPDGLHVLHHCDHPPCVNPEHLFLGTNADNVRDKVNKGRAVSKGKLTQAEVLEIRRLRAMGRTAASIAEDFRISRSAVCAACNGRTWRRVTGGGAVPAANGRAWRREQRAALEDALRRMQEGTDG